MVLTYDLLEDRRIDDVIIKTFTLCFLKMAESFENLADWEDEDLEKSLAEAVDSYDKQEEEKKTRFSVENDLTRLAIFMSVKVAKFEIKRLFFPYILIL